VPVIGAGVLDADASAAWAPDGHLRVLGDRGDRRRRVSALYGTQARSAPSTFSCFGWKSRQCPVSWHAGRGVARNVSRAPSRSATTFPGGLRVAPSMPYGTGRVSRSLAMLPAYVFQLPGPSPAPVWIRNRPLGPHLNSNCCGVAGA